MFELEVHVAAVASGFHREVHPDGRTPFLEDKLIKIHLLPVRDIQQDTAIAYRLLHPRTVDVHRTARQMVRVGCLHYNKRNVTMLYSRFNFK